MKVFVLINTYDDTIDGTFTLEGKREKELEFLANAIKAKEAHIDEIGLLVSNIEENGFRNIYYYSFQIKGKVEIFLKEKMQNNT